MGFPSTLEYVGIHRISFHKVAYNSLWYKHLQHIICWWISYIRAIPHWRLAPKNLIDTAFNDPNLATERLPAVSGKGFCRQMLASDLKPKNKPNAAPASIILWVRVILRHDCMNRCASIRTLKSNALKSLPLAQTIFFRVQSSGISAKISCQESGIAPYILLPS
jgi:hypothetical protein